MRRGLTLAWVLALVAAFHWWDVTLRFPRLLVWTWAFLGLFLGTAAVLFGRGMRARRREVWLPAAVWVTLALGADLATVLFPAVSVEGRRVAAAVWLPIVDLVLPIWMTARALALVWTGASLWSFAAVAVPALAVWAWSVMIRMPGRSRGRSASVTTPGHRRSRALSPICTTRWRGSATRSRCSPSPREDRRSTTWRS